MTKHDMPSLQFVVDGGRLVPAGPYEAEVLATYSRGAQLTVTLHQKRSLPLLKKYFAVLRDVVENCNTPWNSTEEASDALKLALGITDIGKTVSGQWFIRPGSISFNSMDQAAFRDFFDKAMAVLARVTGIDPEELSKRYRHIPETDSSSSASPLADESAGSGAPAHEAAPGTNSNDETEPVDPEWIKLFARMVAAAIGPSEEDLVQVASGLYREGLSEDQRAKAKSIITYARQACRNELERADAVQVIAGIAGVPVEEMEA